MGAILVHAWTVALVLRSVWPWLAAEPGVPVEPATQISSGIESRLEGTWVLPRGDEVTLRSVAEGLRMSWPYLSRATGPFTFVGEGKAMALPRNQFRLEIDAENTWIWVDGHLCRTANVRFRANGEIRDRPGGGLLMHRCEFVVGYECPHQKGESAMDCGGTWK